jgi:hypothetical protein
MRTIGFAPWKPLPPIIDDPDWDVETFSDQEQRWRDLGLNDDDAPDAPITPEGTT